PGGYLHRTIGPAESHYTHLTRSHRPIKPPPLHPHHPFPKSTDPRIRPRHRRCSIQHSHPLLRCISRHLYTRRIRLIFNNCSRYPSSSR
ncbi:hypothetical protein AGABI2DRAFT_195363, partial [Agaricus bisporus var. bisporus H97]|uniref:hypothetical protein n=1 Tax=Agaricus bisporus var. bisporus (strain H97 / ATCC MYA-4626 / FGSC 10389) TaxID=936046 RepID=UPI00029F513D